MGKNYILFLTYNTSPQTKRDRIKELILAGIPTEQIAKLVKTSSGYIYKERGKLKHEGLLPTHQSLVLSDGQHEISLIKSHSDVENYTLETQSKLDRTGNALDFDIPSMSQNDVKSMYDCFKEKRGPAYVIAEFGFRPDIVQREYERYMWMLARDPFELQKYLSSQIVNASPQVQPTIEKSTNDLLTNDELILLINHITQEHAEEHLKKALTDTSVPLPEGNVRVGCRKCNRIESGVLLDKTTEFGNSVYINIGRPHLCSACASARKEGYLEGRNSA